MRKGNRFLALLLTVVLLVSSLPLGAFAVSVGETEMTDEAKTIYDSFKDNLVKSEVKTNDGYIGTAVHLYIYTDGQEAEGKRDVIFYVINHGTERIGQESDTSIVGSYIDEGYVVIVVDYLDDERAISPNIEHSLAKLRTYYMIDKTGFSGTNITVNTNYAYFLPAGYRLARDIVYWEQDKHASYGTLNYIMGAWNDYIAGQKTVYYAYHTGDSSCTFDHEANPDAECIAGAPQEIDGEVVAYSAGQKAPTVSRVEDCRKKDGSPLDYRLRMDIVYPSDPLYETPVYAMAATQAEMHMHTCEDTSCHFVGFTFNGYTALTFDFVYVPMARADHYGYFSAFGTYAQNASKMARAAMRCIRYYGEQFGYNDELIGVAGISKGSPPPGVLSVVGNAAMPENQRFPEDPNGDRFEGDTLDENGNVIATIEQPFMTYEQGYDGTADYYGTDADKTGAISSEITVAYCASGPGAQWIYNGHLKNQTYVPTVISSGKNDEYSMWSWWPGHESYYQNNVTSPFLSMPMENAGHDYPIYYDDIRGFDRYPQLINFFNYYLKDDESQSEVLWVQPLEGSVGASVNTSLKVQFLVPVDTDTLSEITVTNVTTGEDVGGEWSWVNKMSGLYTFTADNMEALTEYRVDIPTTVKTYDGENIGKAYSRTFTTEGEKAVRPVADTYVSEANPDANYGSADTVYIGGSSDDERIYFATFNTEVFEGVGKVELRLSGNGLSLQDVQIYVLNDYAIDESLTWNTMPTLSEKDLLGVFVLPSDSEVKMDLADLADRVSGETFTLVFRNNANNSHSFSEDFSNVTLKRDDSVENKVYSTANDNGGVFAYTIGGGGSPAIDSTLGCMKYTCVYNYGRLKIFDTFSSSALTEFDIGRKFLVSFRVMTDHDGRVEYGVMSANGGSRVSGYTGPASTYNQSFYIPAGNGTVNTVANEWKTVSFYVSIDKTMVEQQVGLLTLQTNSGSTTQQGFWYDDITITEVEPSSSLPSLESDVATVALITQSLETGHAIADTYVSAYAPEQVNGSSASLFVNGGDEENVILATYSKAHLADKDYAELTLSVDGTVDVNVYAIDGYTMDESTMNYSVFKTLNLDKAVLVGSYTLSDGLNKLDISKVIDEIENNRFTLVIRATDKGGHSYAENFDSYEEGTVLPTGAESATVSGITHYYGFSDQYFYRGGGDTRDIAVTVDPDNADNKVMYVTRDSKAFRFKLYNSMSHDELTSDDADTTYRISFKVKSATEQNVGVAVGVVNSNGYSSSDFHKTVNTTGIGSDGWTSITMDFCPAELAGAANEPMFYIEMLTTSAGYYFDDLLVTEVGATGAVVSANAGKSPMTVGGDNYKLPFADTFLSSKNPDRVAGSHSQLYIDAGQNLWAASFYSKPLENKDYMELTLPVLNAADLPVNIYILDGYSVKEDTLTYNKLLSEATLDDSTLAGTATLRSGSNTLRVFDISNRVKGEVFTVVLRASGANAHSYEETFESYSENAAIPWKNDAGTEKIDGVTYYYGFTGGYFCRKGATTTAITAVTDPADETNRVIKTMRPSNGFRFKLFNALSYDLLTSADANTTYRLTFKVKSATENTNVDVMYGVIPSSGSTYISSKTTTSIGWEEWTEISFDYTLDGSLIGKSTEPMFCLEPKTTNAYYYFDDIRVVEVVNGLEKGATVNAIESGNCGVRLSGVAIDGTLSEGYVSSLTPDRVMNGGDALLAENGAESAEKLAFMSFAATDIRGMEQIIFNLPVENDAAVRASIYYIDNYWVDTNSLTYNSMPDFSDGYLGTYDLAKGTNKLDLAALAGKITGDVFTLVIRVEKSDYHIYEQTFDNMEIDTSAADSATKSKTLTYNTSYNNTATVDGTTHEYGFTSESYFWRAGGAEARLKVAVDPDDANNQVMTMVATQTYNRVKFYNALSHDDLTSADANVTYRISFRAKSNSETGAMFVYGAMSTSGSTWYGGSKTATVTNAGWTEISYDFTLGTNATAASEPMFTLNPLVVGPIFYFDDFRIEVLSSDKKEHVAIITTEGMSFEDPNLGNEISIDLDDKITVLETTVHNTEAGEKDTVTDIFRVSDGSTTKSLLSMENDTGKLFFEMDGEKYYLHNNSGTTYFNANDGELRVVAIYDDVNGTVRFAVNNLLASYTRDGVISVTDGLHIIDGGLSGETTVRVFRRAGVGEVTFGELSYSVLKADTAEIIGVQKAISSNAVRILAGIDSLYYNKIGFTVELLDENGDAVQTQSVYSYNSVFTSINVDGVEETAEALGYKYIACLVIYDIDSNGTIRVTPHVTLDGDNAGASVTYRVQYDGSLSIEKIN